MRQTIKLRLGRRRHGWASGANLVVSSMPTGRQRNVRSGCAPVLEPKLTASGAPLFSIVGSTQSVALVAYEHLNPVKVRVKEHLTSKFRIEGWLRLPGKQKGSGDRFGGKVSSCAGENIDSESVLQYDRGVS
jgi:hypothetical protein